MWQHWQLTQIIIIIYVLLTGLYALRYDRRRREFRNSWLLQVYAIIHNILILLLLPLQFLHSVVINMYSMPGMFPSQVYIDWLLIFLRTMSTFSTLLTRWQHERRLCDIVAELSRLDMKFDSVKRHSPRMKKLIYSKIFIVCCFFGYACINIWYLYMKSYIYNVAGAFCVVNSMFLLNMTVLHYFVPLWHISYQLLQLNDKLQNIRVEFANLTMLRMTKSDQLQAQLATELCTLSATHAQLSQLLVRLNSNFKYKLMATIATYFVCNVSFCNFLLLLATGFYPMGFDVLVMNMVLFGICFVDLLLLIFLADHFINFPAEVASILQQFVGLTTKEWLLIERSSELVSLQLLTCNFEINVLGLFVINRRTVFSFASSCLLYIIFCMQEDYNRKLN